MCYRSLLSFWTISGIRLSLENSAARRSVNFVILSVNLIRMYLNQKFADNILYEMAIISKNWFAFFDAINSIHSWYWVLTSKNHFLIPTNDHQLHVLRIVFNRLPHPVVIDIDLRFILRNRVIFINAIIFRVHALFCNNYSSSGLFLILLLS